jgi:hypothetical protein
MGGGGSSPHPARATNKDKEAINDRTFIDSMSLACRKRLLKASMRRHGITLGFRGDAGRAHAAVAPASGTLTDHCPEATVFTAVVADVG